MARYEILFLTVPEITADEASTLEKQVDKVIADSEGKVLSYERWGKYRLAYQVRKYDYGIYYLVRFDIDDSPKKDALLEELKILFQVRFVDVVMRHTIVALDPQASLDYKRPESLEEVPTKEMDNFLKESKNVMGSSQEESYDQERA
ncbi:30S ribosomal protein S6 [Candidatus Dependentiae bacterium]|nr:30S ribosomal protein S6 [Candidatus Dependentiae bacterium]